jgi:carboxyl-terminal processing protease
MYRLAGLFGEVVALVRTNYVEEVSYDRLELGALTGMVEAADPGGSFVPQEWLASFEKAQHRVVPAFGLLLGKRSSYPTVLQVIPGSPAATAGILPGELIERVGKDPVRARPLWLAMVLLDKAESDGSQVTLDVIDRHLSGKRAVTLSGKGAAVPAPTVEDRNGTPVTHLQEVTPASAKAVAQALGASAATAVVIDLRGVALGSPEGAAELAAVLAGGKAEVKLVDRDGKEQSLAAIGPARTWQVVACVDTTTAGPAELLALALRARGAKLVGLETYGDTGQRRPQHGPGGEVWLATSWAVTPDGTALLGDGLKPDENVVPGHTGDAILDRALELARGTAVPKAA